MFKKKKKKKIKSKGKKTPTNVQSNTLTLTAVHLVTVEASEGLSPAGQTHRPRTTSSSLLDAGHGPAQAAIYQCL